MVKEGERWEKELGDFVAIWSLAIAGGKDEDLGPFKGITFLR